MSEGEFLVDGWLNCFLRGIWLQSAYRTSGMTSPNAPTAVSTLPEWNFDKHRSEEQNPRLLYGERRTNFSHQRCEDEFGREVQRITLRCVWSRTSRNKPFLHIIFQWQKSCISIPPELQHFIGDVVEVGFSVTNLHKVAQNIEAGERLYSFQNNLQK